ncbi:MAG: helix-turn-helix domain-containing protein [Gemmatimonadaceae bacterium]
MSEAARSPTIPCVLVYSSRDRARGFSRGSSPHRFGHTVVARTVQEFDRAIRCDLIDAAVVDVGGHGDDAWIVGERAADFPSTPFFALLPLRTTDGSAVARCAALGFADVLCERVDDPCASELIAPQSYSARFARALAEPPAALGLVSGTQRKAWQAIVRFGGRPVTTSMLAAEIGITREHLSRNFARGKGANLKRVIDLVRLISAAELSKNPGYDVRDVAAVLGFASSSHLAVTTQRIASTRPASLSGLRAVDLIDRFVQGRTRSRVAGHEGL